ncbi:hypothetical protein PGB90_006945 [Kerria lacca]
MNRNNEYSSREERSKKRQRGKWYAARSHLFDLASYHASDVSAEYRHYRGLT